MKCVSTGFVLIRSGSDQALIATDTHTIKVQFDVSDDPGIEGLKCAHVSTSTIAPKRLVKDDTACADSLYDFGDDL